MANKDLTLNPKITKAAFEEFMQNGFRKASVHNIAKKAQVTTGALYTRYKNKDELFCSLIQNAITAISEKSTQLRTLYDYAAQTKNFDDIFKAMKVEERIHIETLFEYYEECQLLFCRSDGSLIEQKLIECEKLKIKETCSFMEDIAVKKVDYNVIELIMSQEVEFYRYILNKGFTKEEAVAFIEKVDLFFEAGWRVIFKEIMEK